MKALYDKLYVDNEKEKESKTFWSIVYKIIIGIASLASGYGGFQLGLLF